VPDRGNGYPDTIGAILAGGLARRMGGGDKPLRLLGGRPLLARVAERLRPQVTGLVLNANRNVERFAPYGWPIVADSVAGYPGPLAGVLSALDWAAGEGMEWVVTVPGDAPFIPADLVSRLHAARTERGAVLAIAASGGRTHPVVGLWPVTLRDEIRRALTLGVRKMGLFTSRYPLAIAEWPVAAFDPFFNINTSDDLSEAERLGGYA